MKSERESIEISRIIDFWIDKSNVFKGFIDLNEPTCWACGQGWDGRYDIVGGDYLKAWAKCPLQICHIIPHSLGGTEEPSNLVLMCKECHDLAPKANTIKDHLIRILTIGFIVSSVVWMICPQSLGVITGPISIIIGSLSGVASTKKTLLSLSRR